MEINKQQPKISIKSSLIKFIAVFCLCCLLTASCGTGTTRSPNSPNSPNNDRVTIGTTLKLRTIDPADAYEIISGQLLRNLGDTLYTYKSGTTELTPGLATAMPKVSKNGLTYTIPLRQGVIFHDDTPFNAAAMEFSLQRFIKNGGRPAFLLGDAIESVKATGEYELTFQLKKPFAAFPSLLTFAGLCAISPKAYEIGDAKFKPDTFVGTGPYKLAKYGSDSLKFDAFDKYWGEKPVNQGIDLLLLSSSSNLFNTFRTGAVDVAYLSLDADQVRSLEEKAKKGKWQEIAGESSTVSYMTLNIKSPPLDKLEVRQAIAAAMDRPLINDRVLRGQAQPLYSLIPTTFDVNKPVFQEMYGDANTAKAKELLTKAGYSAANPLILQIWYPSASTKRALVASTIEALAKLKMDGIMQVEVNSVESPTLFQNIEKGIYPAVLVDWYADFFDADNYIQPFLDCATGSAARGCEKGASQGQGSFYYNDRVNQLIDQQRQEPNPQTRKALFGEIQDILARDVPFIPLWQDKDYTFAQNNITGVRLEPTQSFPFWFLKKQ
ncbi:peptide ABC transporter substrate-binding protein [Microcoleus sp. LEGE 07076]|uniref:ABC transporter substrate-binding protein n=1 Tax=Microcoleus sp. LEGE 07076 TaxID=915322 RepID=UPI00187E907F|nr:ABC transporter substrate-binding protein [Microcoleus sp. LEGE 07076]MBE9184424.1 peptide ABC transporter substrate-binding protein [Microcoleus sp. LEGE 07076]